VFLCLSRQTGTARGENKTAKRERGHSSSKAKGKGSPGVYAFVRACMRMHVCVCACCIRECYGLEIHLYGPFLSHPDFCLQRQAELQRRKQEELDAVAQVCNKDEKSLTATYFPRQFRLISHLA